MNVFATEQAYTFLIFVLNGLIIGILFDIFRILRKSFHTIDMITYLEDIIFWILTGIITLYTIFTFNSGEIRFYIFLGILLGVSLYLLTLSKYFIKINVFLILLFKKWILFLVHIITYPFIIIGKGLRKILFKPISFIIINFRKMTNQIEKKYKNIFFSKKRRRNTVQKKDFNI